MDSLGSGTDCAGLRVLLLEMGSNTFFLHQLDRAVTFCAEAAASNHKVLVVGKHGRNRSAALCVGLVMDKLRCKEEAARTRVQQARPVVDIRPALQQQLKLFELMGGTWEAASEVHSFVRRLSFVHHHAVRQLAHCIPPLRALPERCQSASTSPSSSTISTSTAAPTLRSSCLHFRCSACGCCLFAPDDLVPIHYEVVISDNAVEVVHDELSVKAPTSCLFYHVEPYEWMLPRIEPRARGALVCPAPECAATLGAFNWNGRHCSCNYLERPGAFQILRSAVEGPLGGIVGDAENRQASEDVPEESDATHVQLWGPHAHPTRKAWRRRSQPD